MLNQTFVETCTYATCSVEEYGQMSYIPTLAGNAFFLVMFSLALLCQCILGIRYRTWGYLSGMFGGLALEILGYVSRIQLHYNVFSQHKFANYVIGTSIGPAFFSASIYLCLARIISVFGPDLSPLKPRTITWVFILCDFTSILLQSLGGAITANASTLNSHQLGIHIMIAGLASQVASMTVYVCLCLRFAWNVWKDPSGRNPNSKHLRKSFNFQGFLYGEPTTFQ
jgi:RTA1 like protein